MVQNDGMKQALIAALQGTDLTQTAIAQALGVSVATVNKWSKGHTVPEAFRWPEVERLLGLDEGALATAAGIRRPVDHADEIAEIRTELQRQGAEIANLAQRMTALADLVQPTDPSGDTGSRTVAPKSPKGRRP